MHHDNSYMKKVYLFLLGTLASSLTQATAPHTCFNSGMYVGGALNFEHMDGHRTDDIQGMRNNISYAKVYANDIGMKDNSFGGEAYLGYLYRLPDTNIVLGLEPFVGYNDNKDNVSALLAANELSRVAAQVKRKWNLGFLARLGYVFCDSYMVYAVAGPDWGQFKYDWRESHFDDNKASNHKWLTGLRYGIGIEKEFEYIRVGVQATMTNYKSSTLHSLEADGDTVSARINPDVLTVGIRVSFPF